MSAYCCFVFKFHRSRRVVIASGLCACLLAAAAGLAFSQTIPAAPPAVLPPGAALGPLGVPRFRPATPAWLEALGQTSLRNLPDLAAYHPIAQFLAASGVSLEQFRSATAPEKEAKVERAKAAFRRAMEPVAASALAAADTLSPRELESGRLQAVAEDLSYLAGACGPHLSQGLAEQAGARAADYGKLVAERKAAALEESARKTAARPEFQPQDTAIELEVRTRPQVLQLLTTPDGTVGGLLGPVAAPRWLKRLAARERPALKDPKALPWDDLGPDEQVELLRHITKFKETSYGEDRKIPRVTTKDRLALVFDKKTSFFGKTYPAGRHLVDVSKILKKYVEYVGRENVAKVSVMEFHLRSNLGAGTVSRDAWTLQAALGIPRASQHAHLVAPLPKEDLARDPEGRSTLLGDFYRRANLLAEMVSISDLGSAITTRWRADNKRLRNFGPLLPSQLEGVARYLYGVGKGENPAARLKYKIAWVGFRGSDFYDQPGLYGLEYRAVNRNSEEGLMRAVLDNLQRAMLRRDYGLPLETIRRWLARRPQGASAAGSLAQAWYNRPWAELFRTAAPRVKQRLGFFSRIWLRCLSRGHDEIKMLAHDWSGDPLAFENAGLKERIINAQLRALSRLKRGETIGPVMRDFLSESGLYGATYDSLNPRRTP